MNRKKILQETKVFLLMLLVICSLRSALADWNDVPTGSMKPTIEEGDRVVVNKLAYDLKVPFTTYEIVKWGDPTRGDIVVLFSPADGVRLVKRVVGIPGDKIVYRNKRLTINGEPVPVQATGFYTDGELNYLRLPTFLEKLGDKNHQMMIVPAQPPVDLAQVRQFPHRENCEYNDDGFSCTVPAGNYFMMGDNRDQSSDSRYWGFVPDDHIKGRAFLVWMNFGDFKRIGNGIE